VLPVQWHGCGKQGLAFTPVGADTRFSPTLGYGFRNTDGLDYVDRKLPDLLLRDFVGSQKPNQFLVELPRGDYRILFVVGDENESVHTRITIADGPGCDVGPTAPGHFHSETMVYSHKTDGYLEITLGSTCGKHWNIVAMIINRIV